MRRPSRAVIVSLCIAAAACGENGSASSPPPGGTAETITGRERFGWTQPASSQSDVAQYGFAMYVDGARRVLDSVTCAGAAPSFDCSGALPALTAGRHTLELAAFLTSGDTVSEGPRSPPFTVTVAAMTAPAEPGAPENATFVSSDGLELSATVVGAELVNPVDVATDGDGRVFVAERGGRIRVFDSSDGRSRTMAVDSRVIDAADSGAALLSIAIAPDFAASRFVFAAYSEPARDGSVLRVARLREAAGRFGEAAVVASFPIEASGTPAVIRFGPDALLYLGIGAGADADRVSRLSDAEGKILRVRPDGSTPAGNPWSSPLFSLGHREPAGLVWRSGQEILWELERGDVGDEVNAVFAGGDYGWPRPATRGRRTSPPAVVLPQGTGVSGAAIVNLPGHPLHGDLIASALGAEDLLRIRMSPDGRPEPAVPARLLQGRFGRIAGVTASGETLIFITANEDRWGAGRDVAVRVVVVR